MASNEVLVKVKALDEASATFKKVGQQASRMGDDVEQAAEKSSRSFEGLNRAGALWGATSGALADLAREATAAFAESEAIQQRLETAINATGASFEDFAGIIDRATESASALAFDGEDVAAAITTITQATGSASTAVNDLQLVMDIARAKNISLAEAASVVAAAEEGRLRGLMALGLGIDATMTKEEALAQATLATSGAAEQFAGTASAEFERFQNAVGDALEAVGQKIVAVGPYLQVTQASFSLLGGVIGALAPQFSLASAAQSAWAAITGTSAAAQTTAAASATALAAAEGTAAASATAASAAQGAVAATAGTAAAAQGTAAVAATGLAAAEAAAGTAGIAGAAGIAAAGTASTAAAGAMTVASVAARALQIAMGPVGLALAAVTAVAGIALLIKSQQDNSFEADGAAEANEKLSQAIANVNASASTTSGQRLMIDSLVATQEEIAGTSEELNKLVELVEDWAGFDGYMFKIEDDGSLSDIESGLTEAEIAFLQARVSVESWNKAIADGKMTQGEWNTLIDEAIDNTNEASASTDLFASIMGNVGAAGVDTIRVLNELDAAQKRFEETQDLDAYIADLERIKAGMYATSSATTEATEQTKAWISELNKFDDQANQTWMNTVTGAEGVGDAITTIFSSTADGAMEAQQAYWDASQALQQALADGNPDNDIQAWTDYNAAVKAAAETLPLASAALEEWNATVANTTTVTDDLPGMMSGFAGSMNELDPAFQQLQSDLDALSTSAEYGAQVMGWYQQVLSGDMSAEEFAAKVHGLRVEMDDQAAAAEAAAQRQRDSANAVAEGQRIQAESARESAEAAQEAEDKLNAQADATNALAEAQRLQAQTALENKEAQKAAALEAVNWTEANIQALIGGTNAQEQAANAQADAARLQAQANLEAAQASGETTDELEGQAAAVDAVAAGQRIQAESALDAAEATGTLGETAAETTIRLQTMQGQLEDSQSGVEGIDGAMQSFVENAQPANESLANLDSNLQLLTTASAETQQAVMDLYVQYQNGEISAQEYADGVAALADEQRDSAAAADEAAASHKKVADAIAAYRAAGNPAAQATENLTSNLEYLATASDEAKMATEMLILQHEAGIITDEEFATSIAAVADSERDAQTAAEELAAETERMNQEFVSATAAALELAGGIDTLAEKLQYQNLGGPAAEVAANLSNATSVANDLYRVIVGNTNAIASQAQQTLDWATGLINVKGQWGEIDDLLARGLISQDQYDAAQEAYNSIADSTASIQDSTKVIQTNLAPAIAEAQAAQAKYMEDLSKLPADQQMAALGYMDMAKSQQALSVAQMMASATTGEQQEQVAKMVEAMAAADPVLKAMLIDMGLISENDDGSIKFEFENADATVATLDDVVTAVNTLSTVLAEAFGIEIDTGDVEAATSQIQGLNAEINNVPPSVAIGIPIATQGAAAGDTPEESVQNIIDKLKELKAEDVELDIETTDADTANEGAENLMTKLTEIDSSVFTPVVADYDVVAANQEAGRLQTILNELDGSVITITIDYKTTGTPPGDDTRAEHGRVMAYQNGGVMAPMLGAMQSGGVALVGERGPEMVWLPSGSLVTNTEATRSRLSNFDSTAINFYAPITVMANDPQSFTRQLRARRNSEART